MANFPRKYSLTNFLGKNLLLLVEPLSFLGIDSRLMGGDTAVKTIISQLNVSIINKNIPPSEWLSKMDLRQAISNTFQGPVIFLSVEQKFKTRSHLLNAYQNPSHPSLAQQNVLLNSCTVGGRSSMMIYYFKTSRKHKE
ncbi:hypothetical protein VP01_574g3 [Puccinia sorghi]|uniref:Uncharacterized protein n=1 Tax=Puccinia sorghi TaxID=27349 RepID=A0A0L6UIH6_9BASI|nr:hypothetical protein VP01_574g3 [Puccinia sorghi]